MSAQNIAKQLISRGATIEEAARRSGIKVSDLLGTPRPIPIKPVMAEAAKLPTPTVVYKMHPGQELIYKLLPMRGFEIAKALNVSPANVSQQLSVMKKRGFVRAEQVRGKSGVLWHAISA
jgi:hypothetical protein